MFPSHYQYVGYESENLILLLPVLVINDFQRYPNPENLVQQVTIRYANQ
jgi:hypothetical protein